LWDWAKEAGRTAWAQRRLIIAGLLGGAVLAVLVRAIALLARAARDGWPPTLVLGALAGVLAALIWVFAHSTVARARLSKVTVRLGGVDTEITLDPDSRRQLWRFFIEMTSRVATRELPPGDGLLEEALTSMYSLFERARADLSAGPPRDTAPDGSLPPHVYVLDILNEDLRPCLARWHVRIEMWKRTGLPESEWPLRDACRADVERTRERVVERAWQLGTALGIPDLGLLLPARPVAVTTIMPPEDVTAAEAAAGVPRDSETLKAGWRIYVEAATRIATQELPAGAGLLGEAIASLYTLTGEIRAALKAIPASSSGRPDEIEGLALGLLNEAVRPFLAEWHPRYEAFKSRGRPEAEWEHGEACRAALAATRQRCLPLVRALGRKVGAPPLTEANGPNPAS
jgi:hypothetical protein